MRARVVVFLGDIGGAESVCYCSPGCDHPLSDKALRLPWRNWDRELRDGCQAKDSDVLIIGSDTTWKGWERELGRDAADAGFGDRVSLPIGFVRYDETQLNPAGGRQHWDFFDRLRRILGGEPVPGAIDPVDGRPLDSFQKPAQIILLDITRGFRAAPFLASAALAFVQAEERRKTAAAKDHKGVQHRIWYAAKPKHDEARIWDLSHFREGVELSDALDGFVRHGRADDLAAFFRASTIPAAGALAGPMQQFAERQGQDPVFLPPAGALRGRPRAPGGQLGPFLKAELDSRPGQR